jgi:hypothetical protein
MEYNDNFDPRNDNDIDMILDSREHRKAIETVKTMDRGYNVIWRMFPRQDGSLKKTKVEIYTSSDHGSNIRDAETGDYYTSIVGTPDEDLFFKVAIATGECKSKNGSNTLFYVSPNHYMSHMNCSLDPSIIAKWEEKRSARLIENKKLAVRNNMSEIVVN